jgi:hypothetical protein
LGLDLRFDGLSFRAADSLLKESSNTYRQIAVYVKSHGGYHIVSEKATEYFGCWFGDRRVVTIRPEVKGALMVSVLAFEMTNAFQSDEHLKVDADARNGLINQKQFVKSHETIEYQGQVMHCQILKELHSVLGELPQEMFIFMDPKIRKILVPFGPKFWVPPDLKSFLKAQNESGHSEHYRRWYLKQKSL